MRGTVVKLNKAMFGSFFIEGDDHEIYFSHRTELKVPNQWNHYVYRDAKCEFDVVDEGKGHLRAVNVVMDRVSDPLKEERKKITEQNRQRHEENLKKKEEHLRREQENLKRKQENIEKAAQQKMLADQRKAYEKEHTRYILQKSVDNEWKTISPHVISESFQDIVDECKRRKAITGTKYRVKKCSVHIIGGKEIIKLI